jgi:hypothetical protein
VKYETGGRREKSLAEEKVEVGYVFLSVCGSHWGVDRNSSCSRTFTQVLCSRLYHSNPLSKKEITMSTFDRQAMINRADREYDEDVERMRIKNKGDMYPIWGMLAFGTVCMSLGFLLARSI